MKRLVYLIALLSVPATVQAQSLVEIYLESARQTQAELAAQEIERMRVFGPQIWEDNVIAAQSHVEYALQQIEGVEDVSAKITNDANKIIENEETDYKTIPKWIVDLKSFEKMVRSSRRETKKLRKSTRQSSRGLYAPMDWARASSVYSELETNLKDLERLVENSIKVAKQALK